MDDQPLLDIEASALKASSKKKASRRISNSWANYELGTPPDEKTWWQKIFVGGTDIDAFMMEAAQQVGQSLLAVPRSFALMGYAGAILSILGLSVLSMWTQFVLISLLSEYEHVVSTNRSHPRHGDKDYIASYHDVMWSLKGKFWGWLSLLAVFFALLGLTVAQIVSTASNLYFLSPALTKMDYSFITGAVFSIMCWVPSFRDYRFLSFIGLMSTFYTACYLTFSSIARGPDEDVEYGAPTTVYGFFWAFTDLLFMFGGHTAVIEKAVKMDNPDRYDRAYYAAVIYVYTITIPTGVSGYHTFGLDATQVGNALGLHERTPQQMVAAALMCVHECVAFGLFGGSLFHIWEKLIHIEHMNYWVKSLSRYVVVGLALFIAIAMPFFGVINSVLGAFTTTFGTFIIPCTVYNLYFNNEERISQIRHKLPFNMSMHAVKICNWITVALIAVFGCAIGGWASVKKMIEEVHQFHFFPECYQC